MAKSVNDNKMTRPQLRGSSGTPLTPNAYCHGLEDGSPQWGPGAELRLGVWTGDEVPRSLSVLIKNIHDYSGTIAKTLQGNSIQSHRDNEASITS